MILKVIISLFLTLATTTQQKAQANMKKVQSKYQVGGSNQDLYSSDFFNSIASYLSQNQNTPEDTVDEEDVDTIDVDAVGSSERDYNADYDTLLEKFNDLSSRFDELQATAFQNSDDSFLRYLFGDDGNNGNMPFSFSNEQLYNPILKPIDTPSKSTPNTYPTSGTLLNPKPTGYSAVGPKRGGSKNNPGNIMYNGQYANYATPEEGRAALVRQLSKYQTGTTKTGVKPHWTIAQAMHTYASDGGKSYPAFVAKHLGVSVNTPISDIDINKWAEAIAKFEGNTNIDKKQYGGEVATTEEELYRGLNGTKVKEMMLDLPKQYNVIRGLDNGQPVSVQDELGNRATLHGPMHTANMYGKVHEMKMQAGGEIPNIGVPGEGMEPLPNVQDALLAAKHLKHDKNGNFRGLIPLDSWNDDVMNYIDKFKIIHKKGEQFIKVKGNISKYFDDRPEEPKYIISDYDKS